MVKKTNPVGNAGLSVNLLPVFYQTPANKTFLQATLDQLYQPGTVSKVGGYIGRQNSKATTGSDIFIHAVDSTRQNYQLEPGITIKDHLGNVTFFKDYIDYINQLSVLGANTKNHARLNAQEFYSWNPHIDWDKFSNFQNYYWLPYGPDVITVKGQQQKVISTYTVDLQAEGANNQYVMTPNGLTPNPTLKLYRGQTYNFKISSPGNPFVFKTERSLGKFNIYKQGIDVQSIETGTITFVVSKNAPNLIFYQSENDINAGGTIQIYDITENTYIDIDQDILGKQTYKLSDGTALSNGTKVKFSGNVKPLQYATGQYYVEGVGTAIKLIPQNILEIISSYTVSESIKFDTTPFDSDPFSDATGYASVSDYIVINRASRDRNAWSRYNRWFHKTVIETSAKLNKIDIALDQLARATRPIIEFDANLRLFNFGNLAGRDVDLLDTFTTDIFSVIEGSIGYNIDGVKLVDNQLILFTADTDPLVNNKIYRVTFVSVQHLATNSPQIHLVEVEDPVDKTTVLVKQGIKNQGKMYWYDATGWKLTQQKTNTNQSPLFDLFDNNKVSYSDKTVYPGSTFKGTKIFSYKLGNGIKDKVLKFPLTYKNVNNIGDIVFNFNLATDSFEYKKDISTFLIDVNQGYLQKQNYVGNLSYVNGWETCVAKTIQAAVRIYKYSNKINNFDIDIFDNIEDLADLIVRVYINGKQLPSTKWKIVNTLLYKKIVLNENLLINDVLTIKTFAAQPINSNGYYEIPISLQNNPLNDNMEDFTLGEVLDHVGSIVENLTTFSGEFPGTNNLRDLGNIARYGTKFVKHSGPASLSIYHITNQQNNVVKAIEQARDDYNSFKRKFIDLADNVGVEGNPVDLIEILLQQFGADKSNDSPYYFSDMVPFGAHLRTDFIVEDYRISVYPLSTPFNLTALSNKAVGVYLNGIQLSHGKDYTFNNQGFIVVTATVNNGDTITTYEYENTDGCYIPETPTKLGIWPKYEPKIYLDSSLVTPRMMIQGHDGSQVLAYGDQRDQIILELEKRIFNNIKVEYDADIYDVADVIPSYNRVNDYNRTEVEAVLAPSFYKWVKLVGGDNTTVLTYDITNSFTYNYSHNSAPNGTSLPGYWRGIYRWLLDTDRPNICPWEMLGFSLEPVWWQNLYGPAPYTSDNRVMWQDIADGLIKQPGMPAVKKTKYAKPFLINYIPVNEVGELISPLQSGLASGTITNNVDLAFVFGDGAPVESAWRRSSHYPFSVLLTSMLLTPGRTFGLLLDRSRIKRNIAGQLIYTKTQLRIRPQDILLPSLYSNSIRIQTAGIINYIVGSILNYVFGDNLKAYNAYLTDLQTINVQLSYRVGAFTNKNQFNLLLDSKTPSSIGNVFIPVEDYSVVINRSSPIKKLTYSGVIIIKLQTGFQIRGYSQTAPYFNIYNYIPAGIKINVGGISESYNEWTTGQQYAMGSVVKYNQIFYRVLQTTTAGNTFNQQYFDKLPDLPMIGGASAIIRKSWDKTTELVIPYGTEFNTIQEVVDFLIGYGEWLKDQGFEFNEFNNNLKSVVNWTTSAKEFLFWTTQNWSSGQDNWTEWSPNKNYDYGSIVRYNENYFSAANNNLPSVIFAQDEWIKLENLNNYGSSIISLSPAANGIMFIASMSIVDDINNLFNPYEIFKVDGTALQSFDLKSYRENNIVRYIPTNNDAIYCASFYLIQYEHVVIINNNTIFNDVIYNPTSGYRRERIKVLGHVTTEWNGSLDIPGFIFDQANIQTWQAWKDYNLGDSVTYQSFYYSANKLISGNKTFNSNDWILLTTKPAQKILPNWTNSATQFTDFYSLDVDSFDFQHQQMGQHLIGYQKRQYLSNIIQDSVSEFKFYQGMIREKGTQNVLKKLFDVLGADNKDSIVFYEEWAVRLGLYGATPAFQQIEFILDEGKNKTNPQAYLLTNKIDSSINTFIIQTTPNDVYVKPNNYDSSPWPVLKTYKPLLRSAGYVNSKDVFLSIGKIADITNYNPNNFVNGSYIWCTFENITWNVYRFTDVGLDITKVEYNNTNKELIITTTDIITIKIGMYIGISQTTNINGFYKIKSVILNSFTLDASIPNWVNPFVDLATITIFALKSQRISSMDNLNTVLPLALNSNELVWTDNNGNNQWSSWIYNPVYKKTKIETQNKKIGIADGRAIAIARSGDLAITSTADGQVSVFVKPGVLINWTKNQLIQRPPISANLIVRGTSGTIVSLDVSLLASTLTILAQGSGFTPTIGTETYTNVTLTGGTGLGAVANITVTNGVVATVQLVTIINQYVSGEIVSASIADIGGTGTGLQLRINNTSGSGYAPLTGAKTYLDIPLTGGSGSGATADITVKNGKIVEVRLNQPGQQYLSQDVLSASNSSLGGSTPNSIFNVKVYAVNVNDNSKSATVLAISNDKTWIATGSPTAGYVATKFVGSFVQSTSYPAGTVVFNNSQYYQASNAINASYITNYSLKNSITVNQGLGARFTVVVTGSSYSIVIVSGGAGYKVGNKIKISGSSVGGVDTVTDLIITVISVSETAITTVTHTGTTPLQTYLSLSGDIMLGKNAQFTVSPTLTGYNISISSGGTGYLIRDKILISGSTIGGAQVLHDMTVTVTGVTNGVITNVTSTGLSPWKKITYVPVDLGGTNSSYPQQGVISLYKKDSSNNYNLIDSIVSPNPAANENFGATLAFANNILYIGAPGNSSATGKIYSLKYLSAIQATSAYNPVGSSYGTVVVTSTSGIQPGMIVSGAGFTRGQYVDLVLSDSTLLLSGIPNSTPSGVLTFVTVAWAYDDSIPYVGTALNDNYGINLVVSANSNVMVTSDVKGNVNVYNLITGVNQTITKNNASFGKSLAISNDGTYIAVGDDYADDTVVSALSSQVGSVSIYSLNTTGYQLYQTIFDHKPESSGRFGSKLAFMEDYKTLVVYSQAGDITVNTIFDKNLTLFDKNSTLFTSFNIDTGRVDIYDRYATKWMWSEVLSNTDTINDGYGIGFAVGSEQVLIGAPYLTNTLAGEGQLISYSKFEGTYSWSKHTSQIDVPDVSKIKTAFLYNRITGNLITYLDTVDPLQGKIPGPAEEEIKYKTFYDPATYTNGTSAVTVDSTTSWTTYQVGTLWWNLSTAKFINSYDTDIVYKNNTWNMLAVGASIDIYEWVETNLKPSQWDTQADTISGIANNISGKALYDDSIYSVKQNYDKISKTFKNKYYFWVKNKKIIPNVEGRRMSAQDVASLIANPRGQAYSYLAITGLNTFSLVNVKEYLTRMDVVLTVEYWTGEKIDQNIHSQYKIISNDPTTDIPDIIEQKWYDSLCGVDSNGLTVPDTALPVKLRYGIENRPRQGMFVNRLEALKQFVEKTNQLLSIEQISSNSNISDLELYDTEPNIILGLYDNVKDTDAELTYENISNFIKPILTPIIANNNGKITGINIVSAGKGYLLAPYIELIGSGTGGRVKSIINASGEIIGATIISPGEGYNSLTQCVVRSYSILVHSDSGANYRWSIYTYDDKIWSRTSTQSYDVRKYWNYIDWYAPGFNQFVGPDVSVDTIADLETALKNIAYRAGSNTNSIGSTIKIRNANNSGWLLLEKYSNSTSIDWTQSFKIVGIQNGTIQLASSLYNFAKTNIGYDTSIYDTESFDTVAGKELRIILNTIKNKIFINELKQDYLNLFFDSVRYAFSEQVYIDWIFKTSFVKAQHNIGNLDQPANYPVDNLSNFEDYIAEVKPYRTKIREYVSNYNSLDTAGLPITDFDLQPVYKDHIVKLTNASIKNNIIVADDERIQQYPWKFWFDAVGFIVTELILVDGGSGYTSEPLITFTSNTGNGASARAFFTNGIINRIVLITKGSGYLAAPTVIIDGGLSTTGTPARAVAIIGNSVIRSTLAKIKFDRITQKNYITQLDQVETFTGSGNKLQFSLKWSPDERIGKSKIIVNGIPALRESYKLITVKSKLKGYTTYSGLMTFDVGSAPALNSEIVVSYTINQSILNAADRINYYYKPEIGELGNSLSQLMTGIDYGGVIVNGLGFNIQSGWDSQNYYTDKWDAFDPRFTDYFVTVAANTHSFTLPYTPAVGTEINIYHIENKVDSYISNGITTEYTYNILSNSPVATTITTVLTSGISKTALTGSYNTTLKVSNTTDIVIGMAVSGGGFPRTRTVTAIIDSTTLILNIAPDTSPTGVLIFSFNYSGSYRLSVNDTSTLHVGDILTCTNISSFIFNTIIVSIDNATQLTLSNVLYATIPNGTPVASERILIQPNDVTINANGTLTLTSALPVGIVLNITGKINPVRLDGPLGIVATLVADGTSSTFTIPNTFAVATGDEFILRQSTSDGSVVPAETDYDTALTGGNLAYSSATGLSADDILVDGDGFVTPTTSSAPEEVVPGQVVDAVSIKVFDRPNTGSANILVNNFITNGTNKQFKINQTINSNSSVIVKVNSTVKTINIDYTVDYKNQYITFNSVPAVGNIVTIYSIGFSGSGILDIDYFVGDGSTNEFITKAPWLNSLTSLVYINGISTSTELFKTDSTYEFVNAVGLRFVVAPTAGVIINFIIVSGNQQTFAITNTEVIATNGSLTYPLVHQIGTNLPNESNIIVRVDQNILSGPNNSYFTIGNNRLNYIIDSKKTNPYGATINQIIVLADQHVLKLGSDYTVDISGITVKLTRAAYTIYKGKQLVISISVGEDYSYDPVSNAITFVQAYDNTHYVEIISSYNHSVLDIQRTSITVNSTALIESNTLEFYSYKSISAGLLVLDRTVINNNYIWVIKNNKLLTPSIDYKLNDDKQSIQLANDSAIGDVITLMTFSSKVLTAGIAYMQFKDMLNRVHFKRLSLIKRTALASNLNWNDTSISLVDATNFDIPNPQQNRPGVIEIRGERIEYFAKTGNILRKIRRGTLGTGVYKFNKAGTFVQEIGPTETIPYTETNVTEQKYSDGTNIINLGFVPKSINDVEVFVGGYDNTLNWLPFTVYSVGTIVNVGSYTYRCTVAHTSSKVFGTNVTNWKFFIGNIRLKKQAYKVHNVNVAAYSPEGDVTLPADFSVDGITNRITLTNLLKVGTQVTVVKRTGIAWDSSINIQNDNSKIAEFLKAQPGIWYADEKRISTNNTQINTSFDGGAATFDDTTVTFDQG